MFDHLKKHPTILVTGPHRSGTRITARIIARDTGHQYIDEIRFKNSRIDKLSKIIKKSNNIVVQCPAFAFCIDQFKNVFVVFVKRNVRDIAKSQERIGGYFRKRYFKRYPKKFWPKDLKKTTAWPQTVYKYWQTVQKPKLKGRCLEVKYQSLSNHPLWVPKSKRRTFKPNQTSLQNTQNHV